MRTEDVCPPANARPHLIACDTDAPSESQQGKKVKRKQTRPRSAYGFFRGSKCVTFLGIIKLPQKAHLIVRWAGFVAIWKGPTPFLPEKLAKTRGNCNASYPHAFLFSRDLVVAYRKLQGSCGCERLVFRCQL
jgi:hypothetical protein